MSVRQDLWEMQERLNRCANERDALVDRVRELQRALDGTSALLATARSEGWRAGRDAAATCCDVRVAELESLGDMMAAADDVRLTIIANLSIIQGRINALTETKGKEP